MSIPLFEPLLPPLIDRGILLANHVLRAQPAATERLAHHAGRRVTIEWRAAAGGWPTPPSLYVEVTPAGLLERIDPPTLADGTAAPALRVAIELPALHRLLSLALAGERPRVDVEGDAHFAADVAWLADHLRWDVEHDLARTVGDMPARFLSQAALGAVQAIRTAAKGIGDAWERRPGAASPR